MRNLGWPAAAGLAAILAGCDGRSMEDIEARVAEVQAARQAPVESPRAIQTQGVVIEAPVAGASSAGPATMTARQAAWVRARQRQNLERILQWADSKDRRPGTTATAPKPATTLAGVEEQLRARLARLLSVMRKQFGEDVNRSRIYLMRWFPGTLPLQLADRRYLVRVSARYPEGEKPVAAEFDIEFLDDIPTGDEDGG